MGKKLAFRDRIRELRRVRAGDLAANPRNWRTHPKAQVEALKGVLDEIGYADAILARELPDGTLEIIDGHLRAETTPDQEVPVLVLDLNEDEAKTLLTVLDPLAAMAEPDETALGSLLAEIDTESEALREMLDGLGGTPPAADGSTAPPDIRHSVAVAYYDKDIPLLCRFLDVQLLPPSLGKALFRRIQDLAPPAARSRKPAQTKTPPRRKK
jgi:hypothetical protein